jgi:nucleoside-diphosphate-sugar epimerase
MKIAITGHTAGIGQAFSKQLALRGHTVVGISRREGENIRRTVHTASLIEHCDMFINNAQTGYAQTELLYEVWRRWRGKEKYIWNISTMMTESPINTIPEAQEDITMSQYRNQKIALEEASRQLRFKNSWPKISIIRPGGVATRKAVDNSKHADVDLWVKNVIDVFSLDDNSNISELSMGYAEKRIPI